MQFSLSEEETLIQDMARKIAADILAPNATKLDQGEGRETFLANLKTLAENGFMAMNVPANFGGSESGKVAQALAVEAVGYACASTGTTMSVTNMVAEVINACGSEQQKQYFIPKIADGTYYAGGFCLTESGAGSDPAAMVTKAVKDGDDYLITGEKIYITSAPYSGVFIVWAVTDPSKPKGKGISCFLIEGNAKGISISKPENKMGINGSETASVTFTNCRVPKSAMMGKENDGFRIAVGELTGGRIGIAALSLGIAKAAHDKAIAYVKERKQFGQRLADFQGLQWMLAERETEIEASRLLILHAAYLKDQGLPFSKAASHAKLYASETAARATDTAIQMLGGAGYIKESGVEQLARDARITRIYEGTSEIQKLIIAREIFRQ